MKRVLACVPSVQVVEWRLDAHTLWCVVAVDYDRGEVHFERVEKRELLDLYKEAALIGKQMSVGGRVEIDGHYCKLLVRNPKQRAAAKDRSPESKAPTGRNPKRGPGRRP